MVGKGSYGTVRKVRQLASNEIFVRKEIEYTSMNGHERNQLILELRILRELNHPNIVKYYRHDHIMDKKSIHIYMEYCDGGDLAQVISNFRKNKELVPEEFIWQVLVQTLLALHRCHYGIDAPKVNLFSGNGGSEPLINSETVVIHRDIKPDNIFMLNAGKTIKMGDFGLAKMLTSQNDFAKTYVGTPYYMSPEVLMDNPYLPVCDIWSLGCVLFELCTLLPPFQAKTHLQLQTKIKRGQIPDLPDTYSSQLRLTIRECITVDPAMRPLCHDLLQTLSVKFLRKEMELKEVGTHLNEFQKQLLAKNDELKKKEAFLNTYERKLFSEREGLEAEFASLQKKCDLQKKQLEDELFDEFDQRKKAMDLEAKEVRLGYQREFKFVVEQEVQLRLKDIMAKQNELHRKKSDPKTTTRAYFEQPLPTKPRGPRELEDQDRLLPPPVRRTPLKTRNSDVEYENAVHSPFKPRTGTGNYKKRVTDELERLSLERRHTPEFEEMYMRKRMG